MNSVERVAIRTRELRLKHGLTQQELAEVADFSEKFLQQIEAQRKKEIWLSTVERLAAALAWNFTNFSLRTYQRNPTHPKKWLAAGCIGNAPYCINRANTVARLKSAIELASQYPTVLRALVALPERFHGSPARLYSSCIKGTPTKSEKPSTS